jgi:mannose-6-phosphate isomerase-like protein (cupin superfamily)
MEAMTRRDVMLAMMAMAAVAGVAEGQQAQTPATSLLPKGGDFPTDASRVFRFSEMPVTPNANGGWGRAVNHGRQQTGEFVECHETMLPPGKMPHPPHQHPNTELVLIREGKVEYLNDGKPEMAGPGDVIFTASNVMHGMKNVGDVLALYFVVSVGKQS